MHAERANVAIGSGMPGHAPTTRNRKTAQQRSRTLCRGLAGAAWTCVCRAPHFLP